jgi:Tol biopolymer transport system component
VFPATSALIEILTGNAKNVDTADIPFGCESTSSSNGSRLAGGDLYIVTVATGKVRRLTANRAIEGVPAWSPSGRWIAYSRAGEIWLIRPDGTRAHGLGRVGVGTDWAPDWSPDGSRIAFESTSRTTPGRPVARSGSCAPKGAASSV